MANELKAADDILGNEKMAVLIIALDGELGESPDLIPYDAPEDDIRTWATEAIFGGTIPGIEAQEVDLTNFKVRRLPAKDGLPDRVMVRPKTEVGIVDIVDMPDDVKIQVDACNSIQDADARCEAKIAILDPFYANLGGKAGTHVYVDNTPDHFSFTISPKKGLATR